MRNLALVAMIGTVSLAHSSSAPAAAASALPRPSAPYSTAVRSLILKCLSDESNKQDAQWYGLLKEGTFHYHVEHVFKLSEADRANGVRWKGLYRSDAVIKVISNNGNIDNQWTQGDGLWEVTISGSELSFSREAGGGCRYKIHVG
jgi:hypothetical protein